MSVTCLHAYVFISFTILMGEVAQWQTTPVFLPQEPQEQYEKAKRDTGRRTPSGQKVSDTPLGKSGGS